MSKGISNIPWENPAYQIIKNVTPIQSKLIVSFENGDVLEIPKNSLVQSDTKEVDWESVTFNQFELLIPAAPSNLEIPWDKLRVITDKRFGRYMAKRAEEQAKLIGVKLKKLRERKEFKAGELAERAGVTAQTISRIEQGHTDVGFATLRKILAAMGYSLKDLAQQEIELDKEGSVQNFASMIKRLSKVGIDSTLLTKKIIPQNLQIAISHYTDKQPELLLREAASYVGTIYGWELNEIFGTTNLTIKGESLASAYFKVPTNANVVQIRAYSHYAYYLAKAALKVQIARKDLAYPKDIDELRFNIFKRNKSFDLKKLLQYVWDMGICVLPLNDPGVFHGASWNIDGRHVIVLKQKTSSHARWIFDLLHELYHVLAHLQTANTSIIEMEELSPFADTEAIEELEANAFANRILLGDRAEELAEKCVDSARWRLEHLKKAVRSVAKEENVREDFLSNYLAFRLSHQGENWWGAASSFQVTNPDPFEIATSVLKDNVRIQDLRPMDLNLLTMAISQ